MAKKKTEQQPVSPRTQRENDELAKCTAPAQGPNYKPALAESEVTRLVYLEKLAKAGFTDREIADKLGMREHSVTSVRISAQGLALGVPPIPIGRPRKDSANIPKKKRNK
jgi:hypothetical protein